MITEFLGLAGSGVAGSIFGIISDQLQARAERKKLEVELEIKRRANESNQILTYQQAVSGKPHFSRAFGMLVFTYCFCTIICFAFPDVPVWTFNPDEEPKEISILWGLVAWTRQINYVYTITTGGIGFSLLHPLSFMIGTVITGINPSKR